MTNIRPVHLPEITPATDRHEIRMSDSVSMQFRRIPAGEFLMGSRGNRETEEPIHQIVIEEDFWMGETAVTQEQFSVWTEAAGIDHQNHFGDKPDHPAENMNWHEAIGFCKWLTREFQDQLPSEHRFASLPCESRWEYACRSDSMTEYHNGDGAAALNEAGWFSRNSKRSTHPVGARVPNHFGLYDMHGNVWEWCLDRWDADAYRRRWNGITSDLTLQMNERHGDQSDEPRRVLRGGSWLNTADWCRSAVRGRYWAGFRDRGGGFRVCLVRSPSGQAVPEP